MLVSQKQPHRYGRFAARWLCLYLEEHERASLSDVERLVSNLRSLTIPEGHASAFATAACRAAGGLMGAGSRP